MCARATSSSPSLAHYIPLSASTAQYGAYLPQHMTCTGVDSHPCCHVVRTCAMLSEHSAVAECKLIGETSQLDKANSFKLIALTFLKCFKDTNFIQTLVYNVQKNVQKSHPRLLIASVFTRMSQVIFRVSHSSFNHRNQSLSPETTLSLGTVNFSALSSYGKSRMLQNWNISVVFLY